MKHIGRKERIKNFFIYFAKKTINFLLRAFWIFPVCDRTILFTSFWGKQYSCNPKYICEYLYSEEGQNLKYVWAVKKGITLELPNWISPIEIGSIQYYYYRLFAKVIVTNCGEYPQIPVRKDQLMINTWHGGGCYKKCGLKQEAANKKGKYYQKLVMMAFEQTDVVISTCMVATEKIFRESFCYKGKILNIGFPRNDMLINQVQNQVIKQKICEYAKVSCLNKICLFAPTYRDDLTDNNFGMDYVRLKTVLEYRFGGEWIVLYRGHQFSTMLNSEINCIDVSNYPDMQELLLVSDVFITDYSSAIWDYQLLRKPAFVFAIDLPKYMNERGFYVPIDKWGVSVASNMEQLEYNINNYSDEKEICAYEKAHSDLGDCETGNARQLIYEEIDNFIKKM